MFLPHSTSTTNNLTNFAVFLKIRVLILPSFVVAAAVVVVVEVVVVEEGMGCGGSKLEDDQQQQALLRLCRERRNLLKSAADHRFALAAAHVAYFGQLREVGETLWRFVEEELVLLSSSSSSTPSSLSSLSSPVITIPSDDFKAAKKNKKKSGKAEFDHGGGGKRNNNNQSSSSSSVPHDLRRGGGGGGGDEEDSRSSHLHWSSSGGSGDAHLDIHDHDGDDAGGGEEDRDHGKHQNHNHNHKKAAKVKEQKSRGKVREGGGSGGGGGGGRASPQPGMSYIPDPDPPPPYYSFDPSTSYGGYPNYSNDYPNSQFNYSNNDYPNSQFNYQSNYPDYSGGAAAANYPDYSGGGGGGANYPPPPSSNYNYSGNNNDSSYGFGATNTTYRSYYMKKSSTRIPSYIYEEPKHVNNPIFSYSDSQTSRQNGDINRQQQQKVKPPSPPAANVSAWDYFNPFPSFVGDSGVQQPPLGYEYEYGYGFGNEYVVKSNSSSPDSREVREREGIPDLEEETETEVSFPISVSKTKRGSAPHKGGKSVHFQDHVHDIPANRKEKKTNNVRSISTSDVNFGEGTSRRVPVVEPEPEPELMLEAVNEVRDVDGSSFSPEIEASVATLSTSGEEEEHDHDHVYAPKKGVSFEVEGSAVPSHEVQSSMPSSLTTVSAQGTRDLREVVREIKDEFEAATDYGTEVSTLLEVGREPYRPRSSFLKVVLSKVCSTSMSSCHSPSGPVTGYPVEELDSRSLASTLDKLYAWENKLYKEVKDEERLRLMYVKQCKKLKTLDEQGAETSKIEATQLSIRRLQTKINVSFRAVKSISIRIHKLRDEELQPRLKELIYGLKKMWKLMLKCHQKQFQAILESKTRALRANTGLRKDSSVRATIQLEAELLKWCRRFNNWIEMQRSYSDTLNGWLERCIQYEPEVTTDGVMPDSPGRIGAPPVFVICHDWKQAMDRVSESEVQTAMNDFATSLHQLWERQDEEQRRRLKAENVYKDFEKQIRATRVDRQRKGHENDDAFSDKNNLSMVASDSGISPLDDLKVDLDSMRQRVREERAGHKEAVKLVHDAVSRSIQSGLIPIFESLENFTSEASKALDDVRLEHVVSCST